MTEQVVGGNQSIHKSLHQDVHIRSNFKAWSSEHITQDCQCFLEEENSILIIIGLIINRIEIGRAITWPFHKWVSRMLIKRLLAPISA